MAFVLGSASPRRLELLAQIGLVPDVVAGADIDEDPQRGELPKPYCERMAAEKAAAIPRANGDVLLTADTTVAVGRRILGKPADADEARAMLRLMSGRRHRVITSICVASDAFVRVRSVTTTVKMKALSDTEIDWYIGTGDWKGKAGAYGIQGPASALIPWIQGSYSAVVGLPLHETAMLLRAAGLDVAGQ